MLVIMGTLVLNCDNLLFSHSLFSKNKSHIEETSAETISEDHNSDQDSQFIEIKGKSDHSVFSKFFEIITTPVSDDDLIIIRFTYFLVWVSHHFCLYQQQLFFGQATSALTFLRQDMMKFYQFL